MHSDFTSTTKKRLYKGRIRVSKLTAYNPNSGDVWVFVYDAETVADVTVGTTPPAWRMLVPGGTTTALGANEQDVSLILSEGLIIGVYTVAGAAPGTAVQVGAIFGS